jgi:cytochrome c-type biogenesis protein CcmH/NrfG
MKVDPRSFKGLSRFLAPSAGGPVADRAMAEKLITSEQLQECILEQDRTRRPLDEILVERGYLKLDDVTRLRAPAVPAEVVPWLSDPERQIGHYILTSLLGTGGMAEVWKAWDRSLGRWVAVKYLKREIGHPSQRIEREGRMAGQLQHPSIISIYERGQQGGRAYLVMPFVDGLPPRAPLPPREAARLTLEVARALAHAHEMGVIHRDVKPANILVEAGGRVVLADFGLAILDDTATSRWAMSGTPEYASPEQIRGDPLDSRTDVYSLGATFYHLLSGKPPFGGTGTDEITENVLKATPPALQGIPKPLVTIVRRAMARSRHERYDKVSELVADLESWIENSRPGFRIKPAWIAVALFSTVVPWVATLYVLSFSQKQEDRQRVLQGLRAGDRKLALAERRRADPGSREMDVFLAAREALVEFNLALRWAAGNDAEAWLGIGRCQEILGEDVKAEEAYQEASSLPPAKSALAWLWARRLLEGRRDKDWKAQIAAKVDPTHRARLLVEGKWEEVLASRPEERDDDLADLVQGAAAIELKQWDDALRLLDAALRVRPRDSTVLFYKGVALAGKGDSAGARAAWALAFKHKPKDWPLQSELTKRQSALPQ